MRHRRMDRSDGSGDLCMVGVSDVGASGGWGCAARRRHHGFRFSGPRFAVVDNLPARATWPMRLVSVIGCPKRRPHVPYAGAVRIRLIRW